MPRAPRHAGHACVAARLRGSTRCLAGGPAFPGAPLLSAAPRLRPPPHPPPPHHHHRPPNPPPPATHTLTHTHARTLTHTTSRPARPAGVPARPLLRAHPLLRGRIPVPPADAARRLLPRVVRPSDILGHQAATLLEPSPPHGGLPCVPGWAAAPRGRCPAASRLQPFAASGGCSEAQAPARRAEGAWRAAHPTGPACLLPACCQTMNLWACPCVSAPLRFLLPSRLLPRTM